MKQAVFRGVFVLIFGFCVMLYAENRKDIFEDDFLAIQHVCEGISTVKTYFENQSFMSLKRPNRMQRLAIWEGWQRFLDYCLVLDEIRFRADVFGRSAEVSDVDRATVAYVSYLAFVSEYHRCMDFIFFLEQNPKLHKILNEPVPELGVPKGSYSKLKFRFLNVVIASDFLVKSTEIKSNPLYAAQEANSMVRESEAYIWKAAELKGPYHTLKNGAVIVKDGVASFLFPVKRFGLNLTDRRVWKPGQYLITPEQMDRIQEVSLPGDIFVEKREWHVTALGIPGFWQHVALFIGDPESRRGLSEDEQVQAWVKSKGEGSGHFEQLLQADFPKAYATYLESQQTEIFRLIESHKPGVTFTTLSYSTRCDSLAILRPNVSAVSKAIAIYRAFQFLGRPYDYDFNFTSDQAVVCSELVAKCYEPSSWTSGITFPYKTILGQPMVAPNDVVKQFDLEYGTPSRAFDKVLFLDGSSKADQATVATDAELRQSWQRPKWYIIFH